ncbi:unnamed protein product [Thlaspi arvense]|uniref:J domain-containing protein n=1 Tax=Thlaspi arvense TaxID=13288 RepID=A0AAU9RSH2_THLAR|nr:unnamed protein product [Thlaspi arvense]
MEEKPTIGREAALRLKALAEQKYNSLNLNSALKLAKKAHRLCPNLDGLSELLAAFQILQVAAKLSAIDDATPDWYKILQVEPFSPINTIRKQYKKLALILHPDKNPFAASEEAFKLVGEAFRVFSDRVQRKEYDMKLRVALQSKATEGSAGGSEVNADTFLTACSSCGSLHKFDKKYSGHNLMCPNCKKSFNAVEASELDVIGTRSSARIRGKGDKEPGCVQLKRKTSSSGEVSKSSRPNQRSKSVELNTEPTVGSAVSQRLRSKRVDGSKILDKKGERAGGVNVPEKSKPKSVKVEEESMTLAEMKMLAKRNVPEENIRPSTKGKRRENEKGSEKVNEKERDGAAKDGIIVYVRRKYLNGGNAEIEKPRRALRSMDSKKIAVEDSEIEKHENALKGTDSGKMAVVDSDFYDFDRDREERSFKKGQIWAIYDDDDGMPRHYGLIDEVNLASRFELQMSWLDLQSNGDQLLICQEKMGIHISCGRFKVAKKTSINSVNIFSHLVDAERVAREVYWIYPRKGSIWALYDENTLGNGGNNTKGKDKRSYDIVVLLTSYSEIHGLSMAYLEKVDGFKTVFKRREIGCRAVRWLEKDNVWLFSHQIPARKLSGKEASDLSKDCWELDPASLPAELLSVE